MTAATATVKDIRTIRYRPDPGMHHLSINLGLADFEAVSEFAREIGVKPEIVQIPTVQGVEIHALLISEECDSSPLGNSELADKLDKLSARINPDAIRHVYGRLKVA